MNLPASRPLVLAIALITAAVPVGVMGSATAQNCSSGQFGIDEEHITRSSPLEGQLSATETVHQVAIYTDATRGQEKRVNGVDAYVYTLGCETTAGGVTYSLTDRTPEGLSADYALAFYDEQGFKLGDTVWEDDQTGADAQLDGNVPAQTKHVVVLLEEGPLFAGMDYEENPPRPYSAAFELTFNR